MKNRPYVFIHGRNPTFITTARQSVLELVNLQSLVAKFCKMMKIQDTVAVPSFQIYKLCKRHKANFSHLQHFTTKLCNFTNFKMVVLAVVIDLALQLPG